MIQFSSGDKIRLITGQTGIFEEYAEGEYDKAFVIIEPDK